MTVRELRELLATFDQDAGVRVGEYGDVALTPDYVVPCNVTDTGDVYPAFFPHDRHDVVWIGVEIP